MKTRAVHKLDPRDGVAAIRYGTTTPYAMAPTELTLVGSTTAARSWDRALHFFLISELKARENSMSGTH